MLGCMAGLTLALVCVAAAGHAASDHTAKCVSERGPAINHQGPHQIQN